MCAIAAGIELTMMLLEKNSGTDLPSRTGWTFRLDELEHRTEDFETGRVQDWHDFLGEFHLVTGESDSLPAAGCRFRSEPIICKCGIVEQMFD